MVRIFTLLSTRYITSRFPLTETAPDSLHFRGKLPAHSLPHVVDGSFGA